MLPTTDQIGVAAYHRWQRRGYSHGKHVDDWMTSQHELTFALNYEVVARYRLDGVGPRRLGEPGRRRCRFCEGSPPRVSFDESRPALPASLGNAALFTLEECDDCHAQFEQSVGGHLDRFVASVVTNSAGHANAYTPVAAFKGLIRASLALVPDEEAEFFEAAVEWVGNPDHDLDSRSIPGTECVVHRLTEPLVFSWAALARRSDDEMPFPYMLAFFGVGLVVFQVPLPLCVRDEDLEGAWTIPKVPSPFGVGGGPLDSHHAVVSLASSAVIRETRLEFAGL